MSELDIPMHAPFGIAASGAESRHVAEAVWQFPGAAAPCFLHSSWRTGKTWFFFLFHHFPETMCFYEPFNEALATLTPGDAVRLGPQAWESGHPSTISYWREYIPLIRKSSGVRLFRPEMSYDWFIPDGGLHGDLREAELKYLAFLARYAQRRRQIPVFGFARSLGRIHAIKRHFPGNHIIIIRNLWDQWLSYLSQRQEDNPYFVRSIFKIMGIEDPFIEYLRDFYLGGKIPNDDRPNGTASSEQKIDSILAILSDSDVFSIFVALHVYLYCNAQTAADLLVDTTRLAADHKYREATARDLRELTGLRVSLTDVKETLSFASADHAINRDRIESHVRIAASMWRERQENQASLQFAEELLEALYAKRASHQRFAPIRRRVDTLKEKVDTLKEKVDALEEEVERRQALIAERDAAAAMSAAKADETEASLVKASAALAMQQVQSADLERERDQHLATLERIEAENFGLTARVCERDAVAAAAEIRADAAAAGLTEARDALAAQGEQLADLQRKEQERAGTLAQVEAEAAGLRERVVELVAAETRACAAEADLVEAGSDVARLRANIADAERDLRERGEAEFILRGDLDRLRRAFERSEQQRNDQAQELGALRVETETRRGALAAAQAQIRAGEVQLAETRQESETKLSAMRRAHESELAKAHQECENQRQQAELAGKEKTERESEINTLSRAVVPLRQDMSATMQIGRELIIAATADSPEQQRRRGRRPAIKLGFVGARRARAVKNGDRARDAKRWELAARHYRKALAVDPLDAPCWVQYGHALKESGRLSQAESAYRRALGYAPVVADTHLQLGHVLKLQGKPEAAQTAYLRALTLDPDMPFAREELAALGWSPPHLTRLRELSHNPGIAGMRSLQEAADAARDRQDWAEAARLYQEFVAADPSALEIAVQLGHALKERGDFEGAAQAYYRVIEETPLDDDLHLQVGHLEKLRGNYAAAQTHYQRAVAINPNNPDARHECDALRGRVAELHRWEDASIEPAARQAGRVQSGASRSIANPATRFLASPPVRSSQKKVYFVVQGLFLKSDSIGFDCVFQYQLLKESRSNNYKLRIFVENFDAKNYPDIPVDPADELISSLEDFRDTTLIYHFCEGWDRFHEWLPHFSGELIIRWHNNTPPWFFAAAGSIHTTDKTISGFNSILKLAKIEHARFWCNSAFTAEQLEVFGVDRTRAAVVYPGSRFILENLPPASTVPKTPATSGTKLLFVSRLVPHKGHRHVLPVAAIVSAVTRSPVTVTFPGRVDGSVPSYADELRSLAELLGIDLEMPGEVGHEELRHLYNRADVFICLSEHEGFGIPLFEAVQSDVPVVAYATTAMRELISDHPLCLKRLNYAGAAARIVAVRDSAIRDFVVDWQKRHLAPLYTREAICAQLLAGLAGTHAYGRDGAIRSPQIGNDEDGCSATQSELAIEISTRIRTVEEAASAIELPPEAAALPREIPANYVTLYDLQAYNAILESAATVVPDRSSLSDADNDPRGLWLPPARFARSVPGSAPAKDEWSCPLAGMEGHIVFGPYLRLPGGGYAVEFDLGIRGVGPDASGDLIVDVYCAGTGVLAVYRYEPERRLPVANAVLEFEHNDPRSALEFRIHVKSFKLGTLDFRGIYICKMRSVVERLSALAGA